MQKNIHIKEKYTRHGTTCLIGGLNVATGNMDSHRLYPTRTEQDFVIYISDLCKTKGSTAQITILLDQLNIHKSESLVRWVAKEVGCKEDLGTKAYSGILKNQKTRMEFLERENHRRINLILSYQRCHQLLYLLLISLS